MAKRQENFFITNFLLILIKRGKFFIWEKHSIRSFCTFNIESKEFTRTESFGKKSDPLCIEKEFSSGVWKEIS